MFKEYLKKTEKFHSDGNIFTKKLKYCANNSPSNINQLQLQHEKMCKDIEWKISMIVEVSEDNDNDNEYRECKITSITYDNDENDYELEIEYLDDSEVTAVFLSDIGIRNDP